MIRTTLALLLAASGLLQAQDAAIASVEEAFRLAGVRRMLESLPAHVNQMTALAVAQLPREQQRQFEPLIREVSLKYFDPDAFYLQLRTYFIKHNDDSHMATFLALERTTVYRTMHRQEDAAETPAAHAVRRRFEVNLKADPPSPNRVAILQRLDQARNTTDLEVRMVTGFVNAMLAGLGTQMPPDLEAQNKAYKEKIRPILGNAVLMQNLFIYRNASDADLEDYVAASQQKDIAWFNRTLQTAVLAVAADRAARSGEYIKTKVSKPFN